jgi:hypothetical protein
MIDRMAKLEAALRVNASLLVHAQRLISAYIAPESDRAAIISELIRLLDGPAQREAKRLAEVALGEAEEVSMSESPTFTKSAPPAAELDRTARVRPVSPAPRRAWAESGSNPTR